ncbi:hypothetical protein [Pseudonocardia kunmingensis]|uniref:NAD-dependent epimerase/dehydratase family protein n=1 Tax=Pseudonocardia kunmingensis TaxID=630975 RepID=A0A543DXU0_9PSEU|nr:hypothetical protein [Pseudonocardia kunmingensis]TQM14148.1 hypothetical protein FB558_0906 [Pseudonocardia kunmingensis]
MTGSSGKLGRHVVRHLQEHGYRVVALAPGLTTDVFVIANADSVMSRPSVDLAAEVYPGVPVTRELGEHETMLSIDKARRVLGYEPRFSRRG